MVRMQAQTNFYTRYRNLFFTQENRKLNHQTNEIESYRVIRINFLSDENWNIKDQIDYTNDKKLRYRKILFLPLLLFVSVIRRLRFKWTAVISAVDRCLTSITFSPLLTASLSKFRNFLSSGIFEYCNMISIISPIILLTVNNLTKSKLSPEPRT